MKTMERKRINLSLVVRSHLKSINSTSKNNVELLGINPLPNPFLPTRVTSRHRLFFLTRLLTVGIVRWTRDRRTFTFGHLSDTLIPTLEIRSDSSERSSSHRSPTLITSLENAERTMTGRTRLALAYPRPRVNSNTLFRSRDESNFFPSVSVPTTF